MTEKRLKKQIKGRFQKGQSGNPMGRPEGGRNKATLLAQALLSGEAQALARKAVDLALAGDVTCLKICLERLVPPRKDSPVNVELPKVEGVSDLSKVSGALLQAVATGELTPCEAQALAGVLDVHRRALETSVIEDRLSALEAKVGKKP